MTFGQLSVIEEGLWLGNKPRHRAVRVRCSCGTEKVLKLAKLRGGEVKSCGCLRGHAHTPATGPRPATSAALTTHGMTNTPTHRSWTMMKQRCNNSNAPNYMYYGGRGVKVCDRWSASFADFLADMGVRPDNTTLDRYPDKDGDYEPGNCRWATVEEQNDNRARTYTRRRP